LVTDRYILKLFFFCRETEDQSEANLTRDDKNKQRPSRGLRWKSRAQERIRDGQKGFETLIQWFDFDQGDGEEGAEAT